jgi:hypothetical protein
MDPIYCCAIGLCCPPGSPEQLDAFVTVLVTNGTEEEKAKKIAKKMQKKLTAFTMELKKAVDAA